MLNLTQHDGTCRQSFPDYGDLSLHLMAMSNQKLSGCDLYLVEKKDLPDAGLAPAHTPAIIKLENGLYCLMVNTQGGVKMISDVSEIGVKPGLLNELFEENQPAGKVLLYWDNLLLKAIRSKGVHEEFWGIYAKFPWSFLTITPRQALKLMIDLLKSYDFSMLKEAWAKQLPIIEMCRGDIRTIRRIIVQPGDDIRGWEEEWCRDYCKAHNLLLTKSA